jgi:hypothetical protein
MPHATTYSAVPLPHSPYGERLYGLGRELVAEHGLRLPLIVWDADEVLWDWVLSARDVLRAIPRVRQRWTHTEWVRTKAGVLELIWGMHHESLDAGLDPHIRLWTDGYPWRLWQISERIPGFDALLGPAVDAPPSTHACFFDHPRVFSRTDFVTAVNALVAAESPVAGEAGEALALALRTEVRSTWKIPELAAFVGKNDFSEAQILVDDARKNVVQFGASGRRAIHLRSATPRVLFGKLRNSVWANPFGVLAGMQSAVALALVDALRTILDAPPGAIVEVVSTQPVTDWQAVSFTIDVPDERLREEWIEPIRRLRQALAARPRAGDPGAA